MKKYFHNDREKKILIDVPEWAKWIGTCDQVNSNLILRAFIFNEKPICYNPIRKGWRLRGSTLKKELRGLKAWQAEPKLLAQLETL